MKLICSLLIALSLFGCSSTKQISDITPPRLVVQPTLPLFTENSSSPPLYIDLSLFITDQGTVTKVQLLSSSGSKQWDSLAVEKIQQWKFIPASVNDKSISTWYQFHAVIRYETPNYISLATIFCKTQNEADKAYELMKQNSNLEEFSKQFISDSSTTKVEVLGVTDINCYPKKIRYILSRLNAEEFTEPLNLDHEYFIFKRLKD